MGECFALTSSLIGGDLSSGAGAEVAEDQRREMLAYDWFMSDSLTESGSQRRAAERRGQGMTRVLDWISCHGDGNGI